jgi:hypothetical protein
MPPSGAQKVLHNWCGLCYLSGGPNGNMRRYEATFEIDSKTDLYAVRRILERVYDTVREESQELREGSDDGASLLREFETLRDAATEPAVGRLTITYEQDVGESTN